MDIEQLHSEDLIIRYLCDDLTPSDKKDFETLLDNDNSFRDEFEKTKLIWDVAAMPPYNEEQDWQNIKKRINFEEEKEPSPLYFFMRVAAILVVIFAVSLGLWTYWSVPGHGRWIVFETGMTADSIILPDESIVFLNRNSSLKFKNTLAGNERKVELVGEGYFEIAQDLKKPFNVEIGAVSIRVLGTSFNVDGNREDGIVELNVTHGEVILKNNFEKINIKEGEWVVMGTKLINRGIIKDANFLSWKTGKLEFNNSTLQNAVQILSKHFFEIKNVQIDASSDVLVTTRFIDCPLRDILDELSLHFEKNFALNNGVLIISD